MELGARRPQHVGVRDGAIFLLPLMRVRQVGDPAVDLVRAKGGGDCFLCSVVLTVHDEPAGGLREEIDAGEEGGRVDLHDDDGGSPGPLGGFAQLMRDDQVDDEGHVEAQDVGLEFLGERHSPRIVVGQFAAVHRDHGVDSSCNIIDTRLVVSRF